MFLYVCVKRPFHASYEEDHDSFRFETMEDAEEFRASLIKDEGINPDDIWIEKLD